MKAHFNFTYHFLGGNLAAVAALTGLFTASPKILYFLIAMAISVYFIYFARLKHSRIFLLFGVIYGYIAITYGVFNVIQMGGYFDVTLLYMAASAGGVVGFLLNFKKILGEEK